MGDLFQPSHLLTAGAVLTVGLLPVWIAGYRRARHYLLIALLAVIGCAQFSDHGGSVWAMALIWAAYDKAKVRRDL